MNRMVVPADLKFYYASEVWSDLRYQVFLAQQELLAMLSE